MKTKTIFKTLALAMLMPAMLLTTACSNSDDENINTENPASTKGYALPVTINVTRQGDDATRATFDGSKLSFSTGDKLFVHGFYDEDNLYDFAGVLTWQSGDTFSGTIYLEGPFEGTAEELLSSALGADATLLPAGYGGYGFLSIDNEGTCDASLNLDRTKTFALTKATAVEQFSEEFAEEYNNGFALSPERAIVCFTISGLEANKEVAVSFKCNHPWGAEYSWSIDDNVTVDATGVATFAVGMAKDENFTNYSLTVDGNAITLPADKEVEAGKIYNVSRSVAPATDFSTIITAEYEAKNGETLTGTLANNVKISIADGATVILKDVTIDGVNDEDYKWAGITCAGDATIILEGTNTVKGFYENYPGIYVPENKTLTIQGTGSLDASSNGYGAGIGGGYQINCGNIVINSGNITATGGKQAAGIGGGNTASCGAITISGGTVTAEGGQNAAGIGGGFNASCDAITISGGTITATGGRFGAGIGSGQNASCDAITISGGTITATGGQKAAGIGGGSDGSWDNITITSGVTSVTATKGVDGAQNIGKGYGDGTCGTVTIDGVANATTSSTFTNFNSSVSDNTWTLTHK